MNGRWIRLAFARLRAAPLRSGATLLGVAAIAALASAALHLDAAGRDLARSQPGEPLITLQAGRICPSTSVLPWSAGAQIATVPGVAQVMAQQVVISDCKVSTTATTFRGVDTAHFRAHELPRLTLEAGTTAVFGSDPTAALVGSQVAAARDLVPGDELESAGIAVRVAAIISGPRMQDRASVWMDHRHLEASLPALRGQATLFEVRPQPGQDSEVLAARIDTVFAGATSTAPFSVTAARLTGSLAATLRAGGGIALAAVAAGVLLVLNASILALRSAGRDFAILRAIGHPPAALVVTSSLEGACTALLGGALGALAAAWLVTTSATAISTEGISIVIDLRPRLLLVVLVGALGCGLLTAALPAWWAARSDLRQALGAA